MSSPVLAPFRSPLRGDSPASDVEIAPIRVMTLSGVLLLIALLLLLRLWYLQIYMGETFHEQALKNRTSRTRTVAPRGVIEDSDGKPLVTNSAQFAVYVTQADLPRKSADRQAVLERLAPLVEMTTDEIEAKLKKNGARTTDAVAVVEGASQHIVARIAENSWRLPGVRADVEPIRKYEEKMASHLLGYIGKINPDEAAAIKNKDLQANDYIGKNGVEQAYNDLLHGTPGGTRYEVDAKGRRQRVAGVDAPQAGATLSLTLDRATQRTAEQNIGGWLGAVVAVDPRSGRVLAMASGPNYDNNKMVVKPLPQATVKAYYDEKTTPWMNRNIIGESAPGSTFKVITAAAGLATGKAGNGFYAYCAGGMRIGKVWKKCHSTHGGVGFHEAMAKSCDVFFYQAGIRMGATELGTWANHFGLGEKTGIDLPMERAGLVPTPEWRRKRYEQGRIKDGGWYKGETANVSIGQGELTATPLQMAQVAAAVANRGVIYKPYVVQRAVALDGKVIYEATPTVHRQVPLTPAQFDTLANAMRGVVTFGTSRGANIPGLYVAGKSGSAETRRGGPTNAWFIAYAGRPNQKPEIAIAVFLQTTGRGLHGGEVAAPIARRVIESYFARQKQRAAESAKAATSPTLPPPRTNTAQIQEKP